ncbi:unnamed protein product, partial [Musa acuminata subsp. burmannicoides]
AISLAPKLGSWVSAKTSIWCRDILRFEATCSQAITETNTLTSSTCIHSELINDDGDGFTVESEELSSRLH